MTNEHGFTLIEFVVSVLILMVGLLGLLQSVNMAMEKNVQNVFRNEAYAVANDRLISDTSKSFAALSTTTSTGKVFSVSRNPRGLNKNYSITEVVTQITGVGQSGSPASKKIDLTVQWSYKNNSYSHMATTVLSTTETQ